MSGLPVVILAGGQGTRLRPLTHDRPKGLLAAGGKPLLEHLLGALRDAGVAEATIVVGHGQERLRAFAGDGTRLGVRLRYVEQGRQLGPGHALSLGAAGLAGDLVAVVPADAWFDARVLTRLLAAAGPALLTVADPRSARHGTVALEAGRAVAVTADGAGPAAAGAYVVPRRVIEALPALSYRLRDAIAADVARASWAAVHAASGAAADVIGPEDLLALHGRLMAHLGPDVRGTVMPGAHVSGALELGEGSVIRPGAVLQGPVVIGQGCDIGPHTVVGPGTALRNHVRVEPFSYITNASIGSNVAIASHARIDGALIDNGVQVGSGCRLLGGPGLVVGADAVLGDGATVGPGGAIGRGARIAQGRAVHTVPDQGVAV